MCYSLFYNANNVFYNFVFINTKSSLFNSLYVKIFIYQILHVSITHNKTIENSFLLHNFFKW